MTNETVQDRLLFMEIESMIKARRIAALFSKLEESLANTSRKFFLKVTKERNTRAFYSVIINGALVMDLIETPLEKNINSLAISPHVDVSTEGEIVIDEETIFVPRSQFVTVCQSASEIYSEYCRKGMNFGWIPCSWFAEGALVQFISEELWDLKIFRDRTNTWHVEFGTDWSREKQCDDRI